MSKKIVQNGLQLAEYDLDTAKAMLNTGRYLYVAFACQQSIEKVLKAIYVSEKNDTPPYTHNLKRISSEISINNKLNEEQGKLLDYLNNYYIESRYTETLMELSKNFNEDNSTETLNKTTALFQWLKSELT